MDLAHQVVVGCAADLPSGILQFSTNGVWIKPETFSGIQCAWASVPGEEEEDEDEDDDDDDDDDDSSSSSSSFYCY